MRVKAIVMAVLAMALLTSAVAVAPPAYAYVGSADHVNLVDTGYNNYTGADWKFVVDQPGYVSLEDSFWNLTVYAECLNATGTARGGVSYTVTVYLSDGAHNASKSSIIQTSLTAPVYGNLTWADADTAAYAANDTGVYYATLSYNGTVIDSYSGEIAIAETALEGSLMSLIPMVISFVVIAFILTFFGQLTELLGKGWRK